MDTAKASGRSPRPPAAGRIFIVCGGAQGKRLGRSAAVPAAEFFATQAGWNPRTFSDLADQLRLGPPRPIRYLKVGASGTGEATHHNAEGAMELPSSELDGKFPPMTFPRIFR